MNKRPLVRTEGIQYAGSKLKMLPYLLELAHSLPGVESILDGFSGTTRVAQAFAQSGYQVMANDAAPWSCVFATCHLLAEKPDAFYQELLAHLNNLPGTDGWYSAHYGGIENDPKHPFQLKNARKLNAIREEIDRLNLTRTDTCVLLTSLIYALDKVDNTLGHYAAYLNKWSVRSYNDLRLKLPLLLRKNNQCKVAQDDIFNIIKEDSFDLAYFDPPYGSNNEKMPPSRVRYLSYYHLWTTIILNDKPPLFGKAGRREDSRDSAGGSVFEDFRKNEEGSFVAIEAIEKLLSSAQARFIILSYSSGGRATKRQLCQAIAQSGKLLHTLEIDYRRNVMADLCSTRKWVNKSPEHKEYLFLIEKNFYNNKR